MTGALLNRVFFNTATSGTGAVTPGTAVGGYVNSGMTVGSTYSYTITDVGNAWETGRGVWNGTTFSRSLLESSTSALLSLSGAAQMSIQAVYEDFTPDYLVLQAFFGGI